VGDAPRTPALSIRQARRWLNSPNRLPIRPQLATPEDRIEVAVIIPALNEAESLPLVLDELPPVDTVIVVDNGSTDNTADLARDCGATVVSEPKRGYGNACLAGIAALGDELPDVIVFLDADHSDHPEELALLVNPILNDDADFVLGERVSLAQPGSLMPQQRAGNMLATQLIQHFTGFTYKDMGPFRAIRGDALREMRMQDRTWGWNVEMQMKAIQADLRVQEVPVNYRPRIGQSKISGTVSGTIRAGARILWATWHYR